MIQKGKELTDETGIDTLSKFQLFGKAEVVNKKHLKHCMERALSFEQAKELFDYGKAIGQEVFFTPMALQYVDWCEQIGVRYYKIRHYDRNNIELCTEIEKYRKLTFISVDIDDLRRYDVEFWDEYNLFPLYCVPKYPAKLNDYKCLMLGMSDHTPNLDLLRLCEQIGTVYFERHVCLTKEGCLEAQWASTFKELEDVLR